MGTINTILKNSFAREIRSRSFFVFTFFTFVIIALMAIGLILFQEFLSENESLKAMVGGKSILLVYWIVDFWSVFIAIIFGINAVQSDKDHMVMPLILSHPISRSHYILGRLFGALAMVALYYLVSLVLAITVFSVTTGESAFSFSIVLGIFPSMMKCFAIILMSIFASLLMNRTTALISMVLFTFILTLINNHFITYGVGGLAGDMAVLKYFGFIVHWLTPHIGGMSSIATSFVFDTETNVNFGLEVVHFIMVVAAYLFILKNWFKKKDI